MKRKTHLLAMSLLALASSLPVAAQDGPGYMEPVLKAVAPKSVMAFSFLWTKSTDEKWRKAAKASAREVVAQLGDYARVHVPAPASASVFELAVRDYVVSALNDEGAIVTAVPEEGIHLVELKSVALPRQARDMTFGQQMDYYSKQMLGSAEAPPAGVMKVTAIDVSLTTTVRKGDVYLVRRADRFRDNQGVVSLYAPAPKTIRLVGDQ